MESLESRIQGVRTLFDRAIKEATSEAALEDIRLVFLSRKGHLTSLMADLKTASLEQKKIVGPALNALKQHIEQAYHEKVTWVNQRVAEQTIARLHYFDVTAQKKLPHVGYLHVYTHIIQELEDIFISMGFSIADGPELETDFYNFQALNIPENHPARDMHDTFWIASPHLLLRTHTSTVQIHAMEQQGPPLAVFSTGRTYRHEATDATHDFVFMQAEGIMIGKGISMANLLATAHAFLRLIFDKEDLAIRVRPGYFPFVEPGIEIDFSCPFCKQGCSRCKKSGWIELLGAGLVHPTVLRTAGIDPTHYTGFAFGMGIERLAMLKYGIDDIRSFHSAHLEFLHQF